MAEFKIEYVTIYIKNFIDDEDFNLGSTFLDRFDMVDTDQYKEVFSYGHHLINQKNLLSQFPLFEDLNTLFKQNEFSDKIKSWNELSTAFLLLTWYSLRLARCPWMKSNFKIKTFNGTYQHLLKPNIEHSVVRFLMEKMGYIYEKSLQSFVFHQKFADNSDWRKSVINAGTNFFLFHTKCLVNLKVLHNSTALIVPVKGISNTNANGNNDRSQFSKPFPHSSSISKMNKKEQITAAATNLHEPINVHLKAKLTEIKQTSLSKHSPLNKNSSFGDSKLEPFVISNRDHNARINNYFDVNARQMESNQVKASKANSSLQTKSDFYQPDNYVKALPIKNLRSSSKLAGSRVESGYYSEWQLPRDTKQLVWHRSKLNPNKLANLESDSKSYSRSLVSGDYVSIFPINKRPPTEGKSIPELHNYCEIDKKNEIY